MSDHRFQSGTRLSHYPTDYSHDHGETEEVVVRRQDLTRELALHQDMLLAHEERAVVILFQGMDGAGKDGALKALAALLDPQGCHAHSLQRPSKRDQLHDYLRRYVEKLPMRGQIGIFNRSYYESVIPQQIDPECLQNEKLPSELLQAPDLIAQRYRQINDFERYLHENGFIILKFFLHLSHAKQRERFLERLHDPNKHWKFSPQDMKGRRAWKRHQEVFEDVLEATNTEHGRWFIVPADNRAHTELIVVETLLNTLKSLEMEYPQPDNKTRKLMQEAIAELHASQ
jgi:PPK2 family polyphosphate:nucleotide phosphotransferase